MLIPLHPFSEWHMAAPVPSFAAASLSAESYSLRVHQARDSSSSEAPALVWRNCGFRPYLVRGAVDLQPHKSYQPLLSSLYTSVFRDHAVVARRSCRV